jgi:alpha-L-fucosidase
MTSTRRAFLTAAGATAAGAAGLLRAKPAFAAIPGPSSYSASWSSVDQEAE